MSNIRKKIIDQKFAPGRVANASGYTANTKPGPGNGKENMKSKI